MIDNYGHSTARQAPETHETVMQTSELLVSRAVPVTNQLHLWREVFCQNWALSVAQADLHMAYLEPTGICVGQQCQACGPHLSTNSSTVRQRQDSLRKDQLSTVNMQSTWMRGALCQQLSNSVSRNLVGQN